MVQGVVAVDPDGAGAQGVGHLDGGVEIAGVDGGRETVGRAVAEVDRFFLGLELGNGADGAKDLFLHDLHVLRDTREDGWLDEVALVALALAANLDLRARRLAVVDVGHDAVELDLRDLWALEGVLVEWVADDVLLCSLLESLDELLVDALLDVDTRAGAAALAVVEEDTEVDPGDGVVDVGIVEDNVW